ncbi:DUF2637 domain-containing protein [Streptomyces sp. P17]|uniref:DUF2637 domain-containing protein n=1 Tax=Streptomyces sp. P17 TaxID=3074716 RepID=UPI0037DCB516
MGRCDGRLGRGGCPGRRPAPGGESPDLDAWLRCGCALVVAGVAAYAPHVHQRDFALQGGADEVSASLWPLSVDGLLLLATVGLLKPARRGGAGRDMWCGWRFCWGSWCPWRPISRLRRRWLGSRCSGRGGRRSRCCCRWSCWRTVLRAGWRRNSAVGRTAKAMPTVIGFTVIRCLSVPDEWTPDTANCH